ncbi:MAG: MBL fold metallo-hydrolase [Clostridia bacterium]|nr:MBL fold metallo-hydrolase [Clostridia bacterium]
MEFKQIYTKGLAHCSYVIGGRRQCIVIDPARNVQQYIDIAKEFNKPITAILETHLHADFISGHIELAQRTGATIYITEKANAQYKHYAMADDEEILIDTLKIKMMDTPGHTPEGSIFVVSDLERGKEAILAFTGDTLLIGDAGRPDLFPDIKEELASKLFRSLEKISMLGDHVEVYPAHGAGSLCGKALSSKLSSTIGTEKLQNQALQFSTEEEFVKGFLEGMPEAPDHFSRCSETNRIGAPAVNSLPKLSAFNPKDFLEIAKQGYSIVDTRGQLPFAAAHIPGSYGLNIKGNFATFAGWVLPPDKPILLVSEDKEEVELALKGLYSVGLDHVAGYLEGGMDAFAKSGFLTSRIESISVQELKARMDKEEMIVVDTRLKSEFDLEHIDGTIQAGAPDVRARYKEWEGNKTLVFICNTGNRSLLAASIMLQLSDMDQVINVIGGTTAWAVLGYPVVKEG